MKQALDTAKIDRYWTPERRKNFSSSKKLLLLPWEAPLLLISLDLMNPEGSLTRTQTKKLLQVNHMLKLLRPHLSEMSKCHKTLRITEAACGRSYLSLLLAWYFSKIDRHDVEILAFDANPKLIQLSQQRAAELELSGSIAFAVQDLSKLDWSALYQQSFGARPNHAPDAVTPHIFLALHACDALSCMALSHAADLGAEMIAVAPCCQAELAKQWQIAKLPREHPLRPLLQSPQLSRSVASDITDTLRVLIMKSLGYKTSSMEFVPSEHTPKNRLILALKSGAIDCNSRREWLDFKSYFADAKISLETLQSKALEPAQKSDFENVPAP